jgi:spore coat polysaccharide biosynthesis protein SpsF
MKVEIYVQARMGSTRLPGKVLKPVLNKPLLGFLIERLQQIREADAYAILTTTLPADDTIVAYCEEQRVTCYRGSENDVLDRYYQVAQERRPDAIVRITADCPLIDPDIVDQVIRTYKEAYPRYDYVSNSLKRTFPRGLDIEIFSYAALEKAALDAKLQPEREHVTLYIYQHPELFYLHGVTETVDLSHHRWTVDTPEDFELIKRILEHLYPRQPQFRLQDILHLLAQYPEWSHINTHIQQKLT